MAKYELTELLEVYLTDCGGDAFCGRCPLGKHIVETPAPMTKLPENITICQLFDSMNLNKPEKPSTLKLRERR